MDGFRTYEIDLIRLKNGNHPFQYRIGDDFFSLFDYGILKSGDVDVSLDLLRKDSFIELTFEMHGAVDLICDRSLDHFDYPMDISEQVILKYGDREEEIGMNMETIPDNTQSINVARYIYEILTVAVPMKKLHPRYVQSEETEDEMIYSSDEAGGEEEETDPRWQILKKLKNN